MLDAAAAGRHALPAVNVTSSQTLLAALRGFAEAGSDGIIQVTTGGADYFAGHTVKARATGALAFARYATEVARNRPGGAAGGRVPLPDAWRRGSAVRR